MAIKSAGFGSTVSKISTASAAAPQSMPHIPLKEYQFYLIPVLIPFFILATAFIVSKVFPKKVKPLKINTEIVKILLLVAIFAVLLIIVRQTRYKYISRNDFIRVDGLTRTIDERVVIQERILWKEIQNKTNK